MAPTWALRTKVVAGAYELTTDILPWLIRLLLAIIIWWSPLGVPFLPYVLGQFWQEKMKRAASRGDNPSEKNGTAQGDSVDGQLGAAEGAFGKWFGNSLDVALLGQLAATTETQNQLQVRANMRK
jgi:hypothetical protein